MIKHYSLKFSFLGAFFLFALPIVWAPPASAQSEHALSPLNESIVETYPDDLLDPATGLSSDQTLLPVSTPDDHQAVVVSISGTARILKRDSEEWQPIEKGMLVATGDQVVTEQGSFVDIAYDEKFKNIARIEEKTKAEFRSIEPTDLYLEDGTIFNALDGLSPGSTYQVSTATAVAAVRGTRFDVSYMASTREFNVTTLPVPEDGHESRVVVQSILPEGNLSSEVEVQEGFQLHLNHRENPTPELVHEILPEKLEELKGMMGHMEEAVAGRHATAQGNDLDSLVDDSLMAPDLSLLPEPDRPQEPSHEKRESLHRQPHRGEGGRPVMTPEAFERDRPLSRVLQPEEKMHPPHFDRPSLPPPTDLMAMGHGMPTPQEFRQVEGLHPAPGIQKNEPRPPPERDQDKIGYPHGGGGGGSSG